MSPLAKRKRGKGNWEARFKQAKHEKVSEVTAVVTEKRKMKGDGALSGTFPKGEGIKDVKNQRQERNSGRPQESFLGESSYSFLKTPEG